MNKFNNLVNKIEENRERIHKHSILKKTKEISDKLYYDELTGLKNRYALQEEINDLEFVSIALIDIDTFDDINELYGFSTGNLVLIETSSQRYLLLGHELLLAPVHFQIKPALLPSNLLLF